MSKLESLKYFIPTDTKGTKKIKKPKIDVTKLQTLPEDKQVLIALVYDFNQPLNRLAEALDVSRQYLHQEYHKALEKIKVA